MKKKLLTILIVSALCVALLAAGCAPAAAPAEEAAADYEPAYDMADSMQDAPAYEAAAEEPAAEEAPAADEPAMEAPAAETREESADDMAFDGNYEPEWEEEPPWETQQPIGTEEYDGAVENAFVSPLQFPLSTFSVDVDTASYSNIRRYLNDGWLPPADAVRVEECINYFDYDYPAVYGSDPIGVNVTISDCPWNVGRALARVTLQAKDLDLSEKPDGNLVFLLDVSGSMDNADKLPLVKSALSMLTENLTNRDRVSIVVYAGASGLVLDGCSGANTADIQFALDRLSAGGSTAGGQGIELAYRVAEHYFIEGGNNRVILCTDGDFNVGPSSTGELERLIEKKRESGVFLSVLGFGDGNTKDNKMETLADKGNGNYAYIDSLMEAKKVLVNEMSSTLYTVAKDVKIHVEFNSAAVKEYRLVGYDNRRLNAEDFNDDKKDAGEMGAGHTVTAFYEIILHGSPGSDDVDDLVFQDEGDEQFAPAPPPADDWMYVKTRYKLPDSDTSQLMTQMAGSANYTASPDENYRFATAAAEFALILKDSAYQGDASFESLIKRAKGAKGFDEDGYRAQFIQLAELAWQLYKY